MPFSLCSGGIVRSHFKHSGRAGDCNGDVADHLAGIEDFMLAKATYDAAGAAMAAHVFGVSACCASASIGASEQVLLVKRKGRTGFKPSGLRDELPGP
jgi:hypothetical protein